MNTIIEITVLNRKSYCTMNTTTLMITLMSIMYI